MNEQNKLPRPTKGLTFKVRINNIAIFLRTGEYEDGTLGEIFIDMYKEGAGYKSILANFAITVSWLLQYGVPLERLVEKFQYTRFEPSGIVVGDNEIKMCSSIIDYIFRRLGITYLKMDLGNVKAETNQEPVEEKSPDWVDTKVLEEKKKNAPGIAVYTFGSGSMGIRPYGYKCEAFLDYCRMYKAQSNKVEGKFILDFNDDSIVIFDPPSNRDKVIKAVKSLWYQFYGTPIDTGDI